MPTIDDLAVRDDVLRVLDEQVGDVRQPLGDVSQVGAGQARQADDGVVDPDLEAASDKPFGELDQRAVAKVVGFRLETQAEEPDAAPAGRVHHVESGGDLVLVRLEDVASMSGVSTSAASPDGASARRSFGRQEPPKAKPGFM